MVQMKHLDGSLLPQLDHAIATTRRDKCLLLRSAQNQIGDDIIVTDCGGLRTRLGDLVNVTAR